MNPSVSFSGNTVLDYTAISVKTEKWSLPDFREDQWLKASVRAQDIVSGWDEHAVTIPWTNLTLEYFVKHKMQPSRGARALALIHVAMYDALNHSESKKYDSYLTVSVAAAKVLSYLFPAEEHTFMRIVHKVIELKKSSENFSYEMNSAFNLGQMIGNRVIEYAENDGAQKGWNGKRLQWYGEGRYYGPGAWEPTPPYYYYPPDEPFAPDWKPWVLKTADQFRPEPPPVYGTKEFMAALDEVVDVDKNLTNEQKEVAKFWVDGHGTVTPAGHWNQIAIKLVSKLELSDHQIAQIFMQLNIAMADTFIAAWDSKYHYWYIRPVTAAKKIKGLDFKPYILTPPFPSYVSGHAAISGAASTVLAHHFKSEADAIKAMGDEAAHSRLLGGIHFKFDNDQGLKLGRDIAQLVIDKYSLEIRYAK
ncbi:vanadium-dependent haloperoxidase [Marinicella sp. X102]|nr:vanadium-dependent haloperoxidase [Marinicella marina]